MGESSYLLVADAKKLGPHCLLVEFSLQSSKIFHRGLSETILLATGLVTSVHTGTQASPLRKIMRLEIWAKKEIASASNRGDYSHRSTYDETRRCLLAACGSPFVIAR